MTDWISTPDIGPDARGPTDRPYLRFPDVGLQTPILDHLHARVRARAGAPALAGLDGVFTFAGLWGASARIADRLLSEPDRGPVGLVLPTVPLYAPALFGTLAAGRIAVLMDAASAAERNARIADAVGVSTVLVDDDEPALWRGARAVSIRDAFAAPPFSERLDTPLGQDDPAFILCTSGTTGAPKPVVHSQATLLHWVRTMINAMHVTSDDRVLPLSSPASLGGVTALLTFPIAGAVTELVELKTLGLGALLQRISAQGVTILRAAPSLLRVLAALPGAAAGLARLRLVQTYGEALLKSDVASLRAVLDARCLIRTTYGATEASGLSWFAGPPDDNDPLRVTTGFLMPDTSALILDEAGRPAAHGEVGELVIRSRYNALGEWQGGRVRPGRLEPDPDRPLERIYRTGDLARMTPERAFVVLGRNDRMIKVNGQRVEPAEIEAALLRSSGVVEAVVVARSNAESARLTAFVVVEARSPPVDLARVRADLRDALPSYMQPHAIVPVQALPRLPSGKVDTALLLDGPGRGWAEPPKLEDAPRGTDRMTSVDG